MIFSPNAKQILYTMYRDFECSFLHCEQFTKPYAHVFSKDGTPDGSDEIDAMIRSRDKQDNASMAGEVNEFLTQLNNCGEYGVIVIGATNKPTEIDEAALRSGRLELKYYIPNPDLETRTQLFEIYLSPPYNIATRR